MSRQHSLTPLEASAVASWSDTAGLPEVISGNMQFRYGADKVKLAQRKK